ncbi:MAG: iron-containing alcohol dehydrogenase [Desulfobacterales bacterium]
MGFELATPRILFGPGTAGRIAAEAAALGKRALIFTGSDPQRAAFLRQPLEEEGHSVKTWVVRGEPTLETLAQALEEARGFAPEVLIALGGGSVLDTAKAVSGLLRNPGDPLDYLEVIGRGRPLVHPGPPCIAVPTTAGSGAEATRNAVIGSPAHRVKASLRSPHLLPRLAVVDPELALGLPPAVTAATGMDALAQLIEAFVGRKANPLTDPLCREGIRRAARALPAAVADGSDRRSREEMAIASLFGGIALANAGLGAAHGLAAPLGGMTAAPHGVLCGRLLPAVTAANVAALRRRDPANPALRRYAEVARLLTGRADAAPEDAVCWLSERVREFDLPTLAACGLSPADAPELIARARRASSMRGNPVELTEEELDAILRESL